MQIYTHTNTTKHNTRHSTYKCVPPLFRQIRRRVLDPSEDKHKYVTVAAAAA